LCHIGTKFWDWDIMNLRGLIDSWSKDFDGLQDSSDGMICTYCKKFPNIAGPSSFISGNKSYRIDGICSHYSLNQFYKYEWLMRISEIFLLGNLSINVPYHRLTTTIY
jgi:hypothetical protein